MSNRAGRVADLKRMTRSGSLSVERRAMVLRASARVRKLAASVARRYGTRDADDLAQLAMLKVVELAPAYDAAAGATFDTFVFRTARRAMADACLVERRERNVARLAQEERGSAEAMASDREAIAASAMTEMFNEPKTPEDLLAREQEREQLSRRVRAALARLNDKNRTLVRACACEGTPLSSVARSLGLRYSQARYAFTVSIANVERWLKAAV